MIELYDVLEMSIPERPDSIREKIGELIGKYFDLVWIASKDPVEFAGKDFYEKVAQKYPKELLKLQDPNNGDWQHGFNSGMLACARLLTAYALPRKHGELVDRKLYSPPTLLFPVTPGAVLFPSGMVTVDTPPGLFPPANIFYPLPSTGDVLTSVKYVPNTEFVERIRKEMAERLGMPQEDIPFDTYGDPIFTREMEIKNVEGEFPDLDT